MIEHVSGYAAALQEEIEAQFYYNQHKHEKNSNPSAYYEARYRLFSARWAVKAFHDNDFALARFTRMVNEELKQEALAMCSSHAEPSVVVPGVVFNDNSDSRARTDAFKAWLKTEVQLYYTALKHPARVFRLCSPNAEVYRKRYALLAQTLRVCLTEGADAAYALWQGELGGRFDDIHGQDTTTFQELDGRHRGQKTGYWIHDEHAVRPILITDPALIKQNQEWIEHLSARKAQAERFDDEVQTPVVDRTEAPKKPRGRPGRPFRSGNKNGSKSLRPPLPANPHVAEWQAEADRKYGYEPSRARDKAS